MRRTTIGISECKICGDPARYSYYGAVVCHSCKVFFKRNAVYRQKPLQCHFDDECDIHINNRHTCSACRLKKCFANGMCTEMFRSPLRKKLPDLSKSTSTSLVPFNNQQQPEQIPISNLLRSDQSTLTVDQWNLLSNLVHCHDEYSSYSFVKDYILDQNALPIKLRFKCSSTRDFLTVVMGKIQLGAEKNRDLLSLSSHDRMTLLRATAQYTSSIGGMLMVHQHQLCQCESFYKSTEMIFGPSAAAFGRRVVNQLDPDNTFIKLMLAILAFSAINYIVYTNHTQISSMNMKPIISIQDRYIEITWRYLLHKSNHREAVMRFSNLIRCLFHVNNAIVEANDSDQFIEMIDTVIERTEQTLSLQ